MLDTFFATLTLYATAASAVHETCALVGFLILMFAVLFWLVTFARWITNLAARLLLRRGLK